MATRLGSSRLELKRAVPAEIGVVARVLEEASAWLRSRQIDQWPEQFPADWIGQAIERGETWLARIDGEIAGTLTISSTDLAWPDGHLDGAYVHRLAVRRAFAGRGRDLLEWASSDARQRGHRSLRLDCVASNEQLCGNYRQAGFIARGEATIHGITVALFERPTSPADPTQPGRAR